MSARIASSSSTSASAPTAASNPRRGGRGAASSPARSSVLTIAATGLPLCSMRNRSFPDETRSTSSRSRLLASAVLIDLANLHLLPLYFQIDYHISSERWIERTLERIPYRSRHPVGGKGWNRASGEYAANGEEEFGVRMGVETWKDGWLRWIKCSSYKIAVIEGVDDLDPDDNNVDVEVHFDDGRGYSAT